MEAFNVLLFFLQDERKITVMIL